MRSAHLEDSGDCIKRLLCELQSKKDQDLPWDEILIKKSVASKIDYMSPILQLQLAVDLGTKQGPKQCSVVYSRLVLRLGVSPNFENTVKCGLKFQWYLRTLSQSIDYQNFSSLANEVYFIAVSVNCI